MKTKKEKEIEKIRAKPVQEPSRRFPKPVRNFPQCSQDRTVCYLVFGLAHLDRLVVRLCPKQRQLGDPMFRSLRQNVEKCSVKFPDWAGPGG